jgi:alkylated DNA repair dioxygenase AlkB
MSLSGERYYLTEDEKSWIDLFPRLGDPDEVYIELLKYKPETRGKVIVYGKEFDVPRWQAMYGRDYEFAGVKHSITEMPNVIKNFLDWANRTEYSTENFKFNQVVGNWYMNGNEYIGAHSDNETELKVVNGETVILGVSYGCERILRLKPKRSGFQLDLPLKHGEAYVMGGTTQKTHTHEIPKVNGKKGTKLSPRVSLTARCFI